MKKQAGIVKQTKTVPSKQRAVVRKSYEPLVKTIVESGYKIELLPSSTGVRITNISTKETHYLESSGEWNIVRASGQIFQNKKNLVCIGSVINFFIDCSHIVCITGRVGKVNCTDMIDLGCDVICISGPVFDNDTETDTFDKFPDTYEIDETGDYVLYVIKGKCIRGVYLDPEDNKKKKYEIDCPPSDSRLIRANDTVFKNTTDCVIVGDRNAVIRGERVTVLGRDNVLLRCIESEAMGGGHTIWEDPSSGDCSVM
jgi:hypothetical protein